MLMSSRTFILVVVVPVVWLIGLEVHIRCLSTWVPLPLDASLAGPCSCLASAGGSSYKSSKINVSRGRRLSRTASVCGVDVDVGVGIDVGVDVDVDVDVNVDIHVDDDVDVDVAAVVAN